MGDENDGNNYDMQVYLCPSWALSLGYLGVASGAVLSNWGSAVSIVYFNLGAKALGRHYHFGLALTALLGLLENFSPIWVRDAALE